MAQSYRIIEESHSPVAYYWPSFMKIVEILIMNIHSLCTHDWDMFKSFICLMLPWLNIYDNNKYSKWSIEYWAEMSILPTNTRKFMEGWFAHSMIGKPYSCRPLDLWIEITMNK